jgi:hypothetical protein
LDIEVQRLKLLKSNHLSQRYALEDQMIKYFPQSITICKENIAGYQADILRRDENTRPNSDGFSPMVVEGITYTEKKKAGSALLAACKATTSSTPIQLGQYRGFTMELSFDPMFGQYQVNLVGSSKYSLTFGSDLYGNITRLDNVLDGIEKEIQSAETQLSNYEAQLANAKVEVEKPFPQEEELKTKSARLDELNILLDLDKRENEIVDSERESEDDVPAREVSDRER